METYRTMLFLYVLCILLGGVNSWFFSDTKNDDANHRDLVSFPADSEVVLDTRSFPFEMNTADDKFLLEATIARDLSTLDACHHRVVSELEGRCSDLSEEEMAKLSVRLFNCQAAAEKRQTYSCTSDMAIAECTRDMDSTTWNAYQIVSNRARSICYAVRQQRFRAQAEITINRLMVSSEQQLSTLSTISQTQDQLKAVADSTVNQLEASRQQITSDHQHLKQAHHMMNAQVLRNLEHIQQKKEVIVANNEQLLSKTEQIQQKLDSAVEQIGDQAELQSTRHRELLGDLARLGVQAEDVSAKLHASTRLVEDFQRNAVEQQLDALENLKHINNTVNFLLSILNSVRDIISDKLEWILLLTDATDSRIRAISDVAAHISLFVFVIILFRLLHLNGRLCCMLITIILLNAAAEFKFCNGLGFIQLFAGLVATGFVFYFVKLCWAFLFRSVPPAVSVAEYGSGHNACSEDIKYVIRALEQLSADFTKRVSGSGEPLIVDNIQACSTPVRRLPELALPYPSNQLPMLDSTPPPVTRWLWPDTPGNPPPTPNVHGGSVMSDGVMSKLQLVDADEASQPGSPASCSSTPTRPLRQRKSRGSISTPNRSFSRPACSAVTKSGQTCKLHSQEGSGFCYRHRHN